MKNSKKILYAKKIAIQDNFHRMPNLNINKKGKDRKKVVEVFITEGRAL